MDTYSLQYLLDKSTILKHLNGIVCAKDELAKEKYIKQAYIVNTDDSYQPVKHWVLLYFKNNNGFYFDSYGNTQHIKDEIVNFMNTNCKKWTTNCIRIPSIYSVMCGIFCLFVLDILAKGIDLKQILNNMFYTNNEYLYK